MRARDGVEVDFEDVADHSPATRAKSGAMAVGTVGASDLLALLANWGP